MTCLEDLNLRHLVVFIEAYSLSSTAPILETINVFFFKFTSDVILNAFVLWPQMDLLY